MKLEKFVMKALKKGVVFDNNAHGISFYQYGKLAALTKYVKYHCGFSSDGRCLNYRENKYVDTNPNRPTMCCCRGCFNSMGYLYSLPSGGYGSIRGDGFDDIKLYARHFSEKTVPLDDFKMKIGFWRPGKGCILPRSHRSTTCVSYDCRRPKETPSWERKLFRLLNNSRTKFPITIRGIEVKGFQVADAMLEWYKEINDKDNNK